MEKSLYSRNYEVNYYEVEKNIWKAVSHLKYNQHDIVVTVNISVPDMIILDADADFIILFLSAIKNNYIYYRETFLLSLYRAI